ncbi:DUF938 domain-containing protein [Agaribacterium sp. ZY112]|uniref:DUF938 domain-containing protein n=1 Tax=Agaribacterium sp. ZY112 TaxID=3233574 RepID=UPI003526AC1D
MKQDQPHDGLPFSQACENNKSPILRILRSAFAPSTKVLEIGSGTGQHAVFFAPQLPQLTWQPADRAAYQDGLKLWLTSHASPNILPPLVFDVEDSCWPTGFDAVFSANTAHIMSWPQAQHMIRKVGELLPEDGIFALYGPFNYEGCYSSESNARFDMWLKDQAPHQGIRDQEAAVTCAQQVALSLVCDHPMPANNRMLVFKKLAQPEGKTLVD